MAWFGRRRREERGGGDPLQLGLWSARQDTPDFHVRISKRARRLSMRVSPGGRIEVVVPPGVGIPAIERFVAQHRAWAERRAKEFAAQAPRVAERRPTHVGLPLTGESWQVHYESATRSSVRDDGEGGLLVRTPRGTDAEVGHALLRWLTRRMEPELRSRLDEVAGQTGIDYTRMLVRRQRTRWGSCSAAGVVSLNVCLAFQRPEVVRYLMVHELCHRRHMNHSGRFWQLVESLEPGWKSLDRELVRGWKHVPAWVFA